MSSGQLHVSRAGQISPPSAAVLSGAAYAGVDPVYGGGGQWLVTGQIGSIFQ